MARVSLHGVGQLRGTSTPMSIDAVFSRSCRRRVRTAGLASNSCETLWPTRRRSFGSWCGVRCVRETPSTPPWRPRSKRRSVTAVAVRSRAQPPSRPVCRTARWTRTWAQPIQRSADLPLGARRSGTMYALEQPTPRAFHRVVDHLRAAMREETERPRWDPRLACVVAMIRGSASFIGLLHLRPTSTRES
jgi:hypothetical protein